MHKKYIGIEIGARQVKMCLCQDHFLCREETELLPDHYVKDGKIVSMEAMAEFLKNMANARDIRCRSCCLVLPDSVAFTKSLIMPAMSVSHLKINLPYEFYDFIGSRGDTYIFDYAVMDMIYDENKNPVSMDLMACAVWKKAMEEYRQMFRLAKWKLKAAAPAAFAYSNLIRVYEEKKQLEEPGVYCLVELGYTAIRIFFFHGKRMEACRRIENSQIKGTGQEFYESAGLEIRRTLEFYYFRNPKRKLTDIYFCGSRVMDRLFCEMAAEYASLNLKYAGELLPVLEDYKKVLISPAAAGITFCL